MDDVGVEDPAYCQRELQAAEACDGDGCASGLTCRAGRCSALIVAAPGAACESFQCPSSYNCIDHSCQREADRDGVGAACGQGGPGCAFSLQCVNSICEALAPEGAVCRRAAWSEGQRCQRWCVFDTPDAPEGHCSSAPPTVGPVPCSLYGWDVNMGCPAGTHPDAHGEEPSYPNPASYCQCEPDLRSADAAAGRACN